MRTASSYLLLLATCLTWMLAVEPVQAQLFKPMRRAQESIRRQPTWKVNRSVEPMATPDAMSVVISLSQQRAYVFAGTEVYIETPISSGKRVGMTPTGNFNVMEKDADHRSSIYGNFVDRGGRVVRGGISLKVDSAPSGTRYEGAPMRWFMRLTGNGVGMHTGILPGYPASHGCVRLPDEMARLIYSKLQVGTPVRIEN